MNRAPPLAVDFTELLTASPRESAAWDPFFLQIVDDTPLQARDYFRDLALGVYLCGRHMVRRQIGNSVVEGWSDPGTINLSRPVLRGLGKQGRVLARRGRGDPSGVSLPGNRRTLGSGFQQG
jgi:hypothetical protein